MKKIRGGEREAFFPIKAKKIKTSNTEKKKNGIKGGKRKKYGGYDDMKGALFCSLKKVKVGFNVARREKKSKKK